MTVTDPLAEEKAAARAAGFARRKIAHAARTPAATARLAEVLRAHARKSLAGYMPMRTEITPLLIITKLEQYDYAGAAAIAVVMLVASFVLLLIINGLQWWSGRRQVAF